MLITTLYAEDNKANYDTSGLPLIPNSEQAAMHQELHQLQQQPAA